MTSDFPPAPVMAYVRELRAARLEILAGRLPTLRELILGLPPCGGNLQRDGATWARLLLAEDELDNAKIRSDLELMTASVTGAVSERLSRSLRELNDSLGEHSQMAEMVSEGHHRCAYYALMSGGRGRQEWLSYLLSSARHALSLDRPGYICALLGTSALNFFKRLEHADVLDRGMMDLRALTLTLDHIERAHDILDASPIEGELDHPDVVEARIADLAEDRAEIQRDGEGVLGRRRETVDTVMVVPARPAALKHERGRMWDAFAPISGDRLPLVQVHDLVSAQIALQIRWPHSAGEISTILRDLSAARNVRLRPTLLVGSPGSGKTSLARAIGDALGLQSVTYPAGGMADSSLMGTSAQWSTARPSVPLELIKTSRTANPLVVLDEVDKTSLDRRNGSLVDALLAFIEPTTSARYFDLSLEAEVDLSHVNWIATANDLRGVPGPLRDRFRVIEIPDPSWEHVGDLARSILDDIADERALDRRWIEELAPDEMEVLKSAWPGGSLRKLRRALEVLVDGRDSLMGRA